MIRSILFLLGMCGLLAAQPRGDFYFVQFGIGETGRVSGGKMSFDGGAAGPKVRSNEAGTILAGGAENSPELFIAVKAGGGQLKGFYGGGYFALDGGKPSGAVTGFLEFVADGAGTITRCRLTAHAASVDDTNRVEEPADSAYKLSPEGAGRITFGPADSIGGDFEMFVSADGSVALGYSSLRKATFVMTRMGAGTGAAPRGDYAFQELLAESARVFQPGKTITGSAAGVARIESDGRAFLALRTRMGPETRTLATVGAVRLGGDGVASFAPVAKPGLRNLAVSGDGAFFVGAHAGSPGELTLEHGVFVGFRVAPEQLSLSNAASPGVPVAAIAPGTLMTLRHGSLSESSRLTLAGAAIKPAKAGAGEIQFVVPANVKGPMAQFAVEGLAPLSLQVAASDPALYAACYHADKLPVDAARRAKPGEVVTFHVNGLGKAANVRVFVSGVPVEIVSRSDVPDIPGAVQLNVRLPKNLRPFVPAAVAVEAGTAFSDLIEIPVGVP